MPPRDRWGRSPGRGRSWGTSDERRLVEMLSEIHDAPLLAAAAGGELGQLAEDVGMGVLVEALRVASARVLPPGVTFTPAEQWFGDSWQRTWSVSEGRRLPAHCRRHLRDAGPAGSRGR
jgi:hypothetical protein